MRPLLNSPRPPSPSRSYRRRGIRLRIRAQERCPLRRACGLPGSTSPTTLRPAAPPPSPRPTTSQRYGGVVGLGVGWLVRRRVRGVARGPCAENRRTRGDELGMNLLFSGIRWSESQEPELESGVSSEVELPLNGVLRSSFPAG